MVGGTQHQCLELRRTVVQPRGQPKPVGERLSAAGRSNARCTRAACDDRHRLALQSRRPSVAELSQVIQKPGIDVQVIKAAHVPNLARDGCSVSA